MEKNILEKDNSFSKNAQIPNSPRTPHSVSFSDDTFDHHSKNYSQDNNINLDDIEEDDDVSSRAQVSEEIDEFTNVISAIEDKTSSYGFEVPEFVEAFSKIVESKIAKYNSGQLDIKSGKTTEEEDFFFEAVKRISKLANALSGFSSDATTNPSLNRTSIVLQRAMAFLEDEFRALFDDSRNGSERENLPQFRKFSSFNAKIPEDHIPDSCPINREPGEGDEFPGYSPEVVVKMQRIASTMISAGYETECCQVYSISRRNAIRNHVRKLEFEKMNMDDASRMAWESLEVEIWRWIKVVKNCSEIAFPGEKKLGESVFSDYPLISMSLFSNLARSVVIQLLDFAEATTMAKRSPEKVFKFLDMYETLQNLIQSVAGCEELSAEIAATVDRIGEAAASNFCDLENSIKNDAARTAVPGGAVHPLTRYVMNYLEYACEYKDSLEKIFKKNSNPVSDKPHQDMEEENGSPHATPFSAQVVTVMDLLDENLEKKSWNYRDPSLRYIFLMNNGRYILQKVKGSVEIRQVMGDTWCRRKSTVVRQYHKNYQRETWQKALQCLNHDGLQVNGKVNKTMLKERFKIFTATFDEIHRTQSTWVVSDTQLRSELQVSVSALVIPAYRSFVGRFRQHLDSGKQAEKYIKYQPEDIENLIDGLFEGNATSMARKRT